jgi:hypothetical protein
MALSMLRHAHFTQDSGWSDMFGPVVLRGVATGLMFVPLTTAALAGLEGPELAQGASIYNLMRQLGGAAGVALATGFLLSDCTGACRDMVSGQASVDDYADVFEIMALSALAAIPLITLFRIRQSPKPAAA